MAKKAEQSKSAAPKKERYVQGIGRRKTAVARVRVFSSATGLKEDEITVNGRSLASYFSLKRDQLTVKAPFKVLSLKPTKASVKVSGGGLNSQAEAVRLGISRALVELNPVWRPKLKAYGFLKRDPRMVERKKFGSRKARRPQQWRKR